MKKTKVKAVHSILEGQDSALNRLYQQKNRVDRLNKAMSEGHISYSEMLTLTKPTKPQADPLNPVEEPEKQAPWE